MSTSQKIFASATMFAVGLDDQAEQHDTDTACLEAFKKDGFDKLDYPEWRRDFNIARQNLHGRATYKTASEKAVPPTPVPKLATS